MRISSSFTDHEELRVAVSAADAIEIEVGRKMENPVRDVGKL
jgi:hypothetical protein